MQLTHNVYVETVYNGANVGFVTTEQGIVMIEAPQLPTNAIQWLEKMEKIGKVKYLINTEGHEDHVGGDVFFNVPLIAHDKTREKILSADKKRLLDQINTMDPEGARLVKDYEFKLPDITFSHSMTLHMGGHTFELMNLPGHTEGQTAVFIPEEKVVFTGDNVNYRLPAFMHECDPFIWLDSIKIIDGMDVDHIVPGHGETCTREYLGEWSAFLQEWIDSVQDAIDKGWSKKEAIEKISIPSRFAFPSGAPGDLEKMIRNMNVSNLYDKLKVKES